MSSVPASTVPVPPPGPAPSVFISYASEDRAAARTLREALTTAGLEVWYDEEELTGGDAWDQKIRRQIRDCDYFMPIVSATTESRKEGYFRREWRLACERTLDMADDVLFLLPVVIDGTLEQGARVPDKFLSVQWLRAPGGRPTPALHHLIRRLLAGEHHILPRPPAGATRPPMPYTRTAAPFAAGSPPPEPATAHAAAPPPMPPMPHVPEKGGFLHGIKFILEVLWWALTAAWMLFNRLPKWARVLVTIWLVVTLFSSRCSNVRVGSSDSPPRPPPGRSAEGQKKIRNLAERIAQSARDGRLTGDPDELAKLAGDLARGFTEGFSESAAIGKSLVVIPFGPPAADDPGDKFAHAVFISLYGRIALEKRTDVGVTAPPKTELNDAALIARGKRLHSTFVLAANSSDAPPYVLTARLLKVADGSTVWTDSYPVDGNDASVIAEKIAGQIFPHLPKKEPRKPAPQD